MKKLDAVLFLHHGLGDLVMSLPLLDDIRSSQAPCDRILVFVRCASTYRLLEIFGYTSVFEVRIFNRKLTPLYPLWLSLRRPRVVLAPQSPGDWKMPLICKLIFRKSSVGPENITGGPKFDVTIPDHDVLRESKIDYYRRYAKLGGYGSGDDDGIKVKALPGDLKDTGRQTLNSLDRGKFKWVGLAPGSNPLESHKRWPAQHHVEFMDALAEKDNDYRFLLLGSPAEKPLLEGIQRQLKHPDRVHIYSPVDISQAFAVYSNLYALVTGCNGASHMAGIIGTPLVTIFGPTNGANTGAWSPKSRYVRAGLSCSPCYRLGFEQGCETPICMTSVSPAKVIDALEDLIAKGGRQTIPWYDNSMATQPALYQDL